jgi:hypothetical protein
MKRTKEQSLTFFQTRNTNDRGDERELYNTPIHLIDQIISSLLENVPELKDKVWIDPCAADGIWLERAKLKGIKSCLNYDLKPLKSDVKEQDFLQLESVPENSFIIGNPPYSLVKEFIDKALELTDICYFLGGSMKLTGAQSSKCKLLHRFEGAEGNQIDLRSKAIFVDTNDKKVIVWTCGTLCDKEKHPTFIRHKERVDSSFRVGIYNYCSFDKRIYIINAKNTNKIN